MSSAVTSQFVFEKTTDGRWLVHLDQNKVIVQKRDEAELIASLPVELAKFSSDSRTKPDLPKARKVVEVCKHYNLYGKVFAVRQLDSFITKATVHEQK